MEFIDLRNRSLNPNRIVEIQAIQSGISNPSDASDDIENNLGATRASTGYGFQVIIENRTAIQYGAYTSQEKAQQVRQAVLLRIKQGLS